jgi:hypothetical protein
MIQSEPPDFLIPRGRITKTGTGNALRLPLGTGRLLLTLEILGIREQQSLDLVIEGSEDGQVWLEKALLEFPQKFYCGASAMVLAPEDFPNVQYLRARWKTNRWGRGEGGAEFDLYLFVEPIGDRGASR